MCDFSNKDEVGFKVLTKVAKWRLEKRKTFKFLVIDISKVLHNFESGAANIKHKCYNRFIHWSYSQGI